MPLVHVLDDTVRSLGTCFCITSDGLCMTARHVLDEGYPLDDPSKTQLEGGDGWFGALYASDEVDPETGHNVGGIIPMHKAYFHDALDIALLSLRLPTNTKTGQRLSLPVSRLGAGFPTVGGMCFGLGYPKMVWQQTTAASVSIRALWQVWFLRCITRNEMA